MNNTKYVNDLLENAITAVVQKKEQYLLHKNAFTRNRKFDLSTLLKFVIFIGGGVIKDEIYDYFGLTDEVPSASAFVQSRQKLDSQIFADIFKKIASDYDENNLKLYKGYRLLAIDGSTTLISTDFDDVETFHKQPSRDKDSENGYNAFHINVSYDIMSHLYDNVIIQGEGHVEENKALCEIVDNYEGQKAIFIADRNYESYNGIAHIDKANQKYLIRIKDLDSKSGMVHTFKPYSSDEFDVDVRRKLTKRATNQIKAHPEIYRWLASCVKFDYLQNKDDIYDFESRIVRFKLTDDTYECIITNLSRDEFPVEEIKRLYHMRWGIETSFRELKYAVDLSAYHAKNRNSIKQEIYARMIFYNISEMIIQNVKPKQSKTKRLHEYKINATRAFHNIRKFFKIKGDLKSPNLESIIANEIEPIRPNRSDPRKVRKQTAVFFIYRF